MTGTLTIQADKQEEVTKKMREFLRTCRAIRRHLRTVDDLMGMIDDDKKLADSLGDSGRYMILNEIRRSSESVRPDPIALMQKDLLSQTESSRWRVRDERREIVRQMLEQAEKVRAQEANDDF